MTGDIEALLRIEPRHHRHQRRVRHRQPEPLLERPLVPGFSRRRAGIVGRSQVRIGRGIPRVVIEAVQDAVDVEVTVLQQAVEPLAIFGRQDLARVGGADGVDHGRVVDPARHEVHLVGPFLDQPARVDAEICEHAARAASLVHQVVNREHRRQVPIAFISLPRRRQPGNRGRGMPVVRLDDVGPPAPCANHQIERRAAEEREAVRHRRCSRNRFGRSNSARSATK